MWCWFRQLTTAFYRYCFRNFLGQAPRNQNIWIFTDNHIFVCFEYFGVFIFEFRSYEMATKFHVQGYVFLKNSLRSSLMYMSNIVFLLWIFGYLIFIVKITIGITWWFCIFESLFIKQESAWNNILLDFILCGIIITVTLKWARWRLTRLHHWRLDCLLNRLFRRRSRKTSKFRVTDPDPPRIMMTSSNR